MFINIFSALCSVKAVNTVIIIVPLTVNENFPFLAFNKIEIVN